MALTRTNIGTREDGSPLYHYSTDKAIVFVGPINGSVTCSDGTVVDVSGEAVEADNETHAAEIAHLVAMRYKSEGHPTDPAFEYDETSYTAPTPATPVVSAPQVQTQNGGSN
jgi:hypothetical protein